MTSTENGVAKAVLMLIPVETNDERMPNTENGALREGIHLRRLRDAVFD